MSITNTLLCGSAELYLILTARLVLACVLGGIIGYERENMHRPAGFRTHILVCVGSALVMVTSEFVFRRYSGSTSIDPTRLGAQVISGIGFLGAGTIIREGFNVKGLTTAASLWAVSCVGIAAGIGFYEGAIAATILIFLTLIFLKRLEGHFAKKNNYKVIYIKTANQSGQIGTFSGIFEKHGITMKEIEFIKDGRDNHMLVKFLVKHPHGLLQGDVINELHDLEGVVQVVEE